MKRIFILSAILIVIAHVQLEFGSWYFKLFGTKIIYPIIDRSSSPEWYQKNGIAIEWWIKYVSDDLLLIITYFVFSVIAKTYSYRLYLIGLIFTGYHVFDHLMLWYNFKSFWWLYIIELNIDIICIIMFFVIKDKKQAIVKSLI